MEMNKGLTKEQTCFLKLIAQMLQGLDAGTQDYDCDWNILLEIAKKQELVELVFAQAKGWLKEQPQWQGVYQQLQGLCASRLVFSVNRNRQSTLFQAKLQAQKLPYFIFKGSVVAQYYPEPMLRSYGDIDMMLRPHDREKADTILREMGYEAECLGNKAWEYHGGQAYFELHDRLIYETVYSDAKTIAFADSVWDYVTLDENGRGTIDVSFLFVYLLLHLRKHLLYGGAGFRQFVDLAVLCREPLRWDWITSELKKMKLSQFAETCMSLCCRWFGISCPLAAELSNDFYLDATQRLFENGVFGQDNPDRDMSDTANYISSGKMPYFLKYCLYMLRRIFLSYTMMCGVDYLQFVRGRPWLTPVAWVYRWVYLLFHRGAESISKAAEPLRNREAMENRNDYMNRWGLK